MSGSRGRREERAGKSGLEFRVSALGFKDDDGGAPTKADKTWEKLRKGPGPHTAGTNVWWVLPEKRKKQRPRGFRV